MSGARRVEPGDGHSGAARAKRLLMAFVALALVLTSLSVLENSGRYDFARAAVQRAKSFVELIAQRSPGHRVRGQLVKTKHRAARLHERALPKVRFALPILPPGPPATLVDILAPPFQVETASIPLMQIPLLTEQAPAPPGVILPQPGFAILPETSTPPPIVTPPVVTLPVVAPVQAVPEPTTWASMLLGFCLIGWQLRGRRKRIAAS